MTAWLHRLLPFLATHILMEYLITTHSRTHSFSVSWEFELISCSTEKAQWGRGIAPVQHYSFLDDVTSDLSRSGWRALLLSEILPKISIFISVSANTRIIIVRGSLPSIVMRLPVTLNHLHRYCCTALRLRCPPCGHRADITVAAERRSERGDGIDLFWPPGGAAVSLLSILWQQITRSTWAVNAAIGWLMDFLDGWYPSFFYFKTMARSPAAETSDTSLWTAEMWVFNHNLLAGRSWQWRADVSRGDPGAHRTLCCFRSMNPVQQRAINSFNWCRGLSGRSSRWWPWYGMAHRRRWVWFYHCA